MTSAEKMRAARARVPEGRCKVCLGKRKAMAGKTVCRICNAAAKAAVYRSRGQEP